MEMMEAVFDVVAGPIRIEEGDTGILAVTWKDGKTETFKDMMLVRKSRVRKVNGLPTVTLTFRTNEHDPLSGYQPISATPPGKPPRGGSAVERSS